jgi:hypothetical protein
MLNGKFETGEDFAHKLDLKDPDHLSSCTRTY